MRSAGLKDLEASLQQMGCDTSGVRAKIGAATHSGRPDFVRSGLRALGLLSGSVLLALSLSSITGRDAQFVVRWCSAPYFERQLRSDSPSTYCRYRRWCTLHGPAESPGKSRAWGGRF